jgi:hypothetical protein
MPMRLSQPEKVIIAALKSLGKPSSMRSIYEEAARLGARMKMDEIEMAAWRGKQRGIFNDGPRKGQLSLDAFADLILGDELSKS